MKGIGDWLGASWSTIGFVALSTVLIYLTTFAVVRLGGRRSISDLSAFDAIVTVALGSTLASTALGSDPAFAQGATVIGTLLCLQVAIATIRRRWPGTRRILDFPAQPVVEEGSLRLPTSPWSSQLTEDELRSLLRRQGIESVTDLHRVLLEPTGQISVVDEAPERPARDHERVDTEGRDDSSRPDGSV